MEAGKRKHYIIDKGIDADEEIKIYPFRSDLLDSIKKVEETTDQKVIGIICDDTYTIELMTQKKDKDE